MQDELIDRFGDPPDTVCNLLGIALLRAGASQCGVSEINHKSGSVQFAFLPTCVQAAAAVCAQPELRGRIMMNAGDRPYPSLRLRPNDDVLHVARELVSLWLTCLPEQPSA